MPWRFSLWATSFSIRAPLRNNGVFLIELSAVDAERERNDQLLEEGQWFDLPIVYTNGRRALMAVEKHDSGNHIFAEVFAAWGER
jgi:hypothetical protein